MTIDNFFTSIQGLPILVVGDLMMDRYLWGKVERISPEAPVPVVDVYKEENRPGGAANVALNLAKLGAKVFLIGAVGNDKEGEQVISLLEENNIDTSGIIINSHNRTTAKIRIIGNNQQMLRVDKEDTAPLKIENCAKILENYDNIINKFKIKAIILEDYDKGLLDENLIKHLVSKTVSCPILVDPKYLHFFSYENVTLFKPNIKELSQALGYTVNKNNIEGLQQAVKILRIKMPHRYTLVTLSEQGVLLADPDGNFTHIPAHIRQINDVSGAGDTVIALMAVCFGINLEPILSAKIANLAGGLVCEIPGVVAIDPLKLKKEIQLHKLLL